MAIVRSEDGRFFDIDDSELEKHVIKPEDLPSQSVYARPQGGPGMGPGGQGGPGGPRGGGGPMQLVINLGGPGGPQVSQGQGPAQSGPVQRGGQNQGQQGDVQAHGWCGFPMPMPWGNWHNWNNWNNWHNWNNCWNNCWHNCS